jgi:hypothetical protein
MKAPIIKMLGTAKKDKPNPRLPLTAATPAVIPASQRVFMPVIIFSPFRIDSPISDADYFAAHTLENDPMSRSLLPGKSSTGPTLRLPFVVNVSSVVAAFWGLITNKMEFEIVASVGANYFKKK